MLFSQFFLNLPHSQKNLPNTKNLPQFFDKNGFQILFQFGKFSSIGKSSYPSPKLYLLELLMKLSVK